jgi:RNA polymerase sigma-70 factor (ECF subfamily)
MTESDSIAELVANWRSGSQTAARELHQRYVSQLTRLAERHLSRKFAGRLDGEDVVQSVFRTFFRRAAQGQFVIDSSDQIWQLLVKIMLMKARAKVRHHTALKRDVTTEVPQSDGDWLVESLAREPGPEEAVAFMDQIETLLRGLPPLYSQVLELRLQGNQVSDVAKGLGLSRQTIYRVLNVLHDRLRKLAAPDDSSNPAAS